MSWSGWIAIVAVMVLLPGGRAAADPKTPVTVKFVAEAYGAYFNAPQRAELEGKAARRITERLQAYIPHFEFTADGGRPYQLTVRLAPRVAAERPVAFGEVGLHMELTGPRLVKARDYVVFRSPEDMTPITTVDAMVTEIDGRLPEAEYAGRITDLLLRVPIATKGGRVIYQPRNGWILPHKVADICLDLGSTVTIESAVPGPLGLRLTPPLEARAVGAFEPQGQTNLAMLVGNIFSEPVDVLAFQQAMGGADETKIVLSSVWIRRRETAAECVR
jgi:hypothetical protein